MPEDLIRLCIGIEHPDDLIDDLEAALLEAGAVRVVDEAGERAKLERVRGPEEEDADAFGAIGSQTPGSKVEGLITSAPGKVILFGEHAVVHGIVSIMSSVIPCILIDSCPFAQTAIAGAVDLRCYCLAESRADNKVGLDLPDFDFSASWDVDALPWTLLQSPTTAAKAPRADQAPDQSLLDALRQTTVQSDKPNVVQAEQAFLYLYMHLAGSQRSGQNFTVRSALPIGAGLGSSAAFSVCIASALLYTHSQLPLPRHSSAVGHHGRRDVSPEQADVVNAWAFVAEKIIHGNPSGVDNTVSCLGGAIAFAKAVKGREGSLTGLHGFKSIRFLLTDTKVSRNTKSLVEGVARRKLDVSVCTPWIAYNPTDSFWLDRDRNRTLSIPSCRRSRSSLMKLGDALPTPT